MKSAEEKLRSYEPLWENWTYTGEFLGEGAMSSVFEIQSTAMGMKEVAALKIITVKKSPDGEVRIPENTLNEIRILRELSGCPNIVQYHDSTQRKIFDENDNLSEIDILIKMEKLDPLTEGKKLNEKEVIKLGIDMCKALAHASKAGIIHRDIKPQNIFVSADGTYKLGDFGIAKIISELSYNYTMNIGTMAYTAPELQNGVGRYDISSDIYSLGLVLYVFLNNGFLPFMDRMPAQDAVMKRLSGAPFPSPANGSSKLKAVIMRACSADTVKRYKTPEEFLADLEFVSSGGKKFVPDPFATLDANIEEVVVHPLRSYIDDTEEFVRSKSGGLRIRMSKSTGAETKEASFTSATGGSSGLKINLRGSASPAPDAAKTRVDASAVSASHKKADDGMARISSPSGGAESKGGLKSTFDKKSKGESAIVRPDTKAKSEDKKEEKSDGFFFSPPSL